MRSRESLNKLPGDWEDLIHLKITGIGAEKNAFGDLATYFSESLDYGLKQMGRAAENSMKKTIRDSVTQWGKKRMEGRSGRWTFRPYGRSTGREETGWMYDQVSYETLNSGNQHEVHFGWINWQEEYFAYQEYGFWGVSIMRGVSGDMPRFGNTTNPFWVPGMNSLAKAKAVVDRMIPSFVSGAWSEALNKLSSRGGTF